MLDVAIDVANAVDYLHRHYQTPIVHRDLKPTNVLLDDNMVAHVGDFDMAKLLSDAASNRDNEQATSSIIKGTIGYLAPECGMGGPTSPEGDIYSYGILMLEMITGKRPTDDTFDDGISLHSICKMALPEQLEEILDSRLLEQINEQSSKGRGQNMLECLVSFTNVGVACSVEVPVERMKIEDAVTELHAIKARLLEIEILIRLCKADNIGLYAGVRVGGSDLRLTHIQFADDLMVFVEARRESVINLMRLFKIFEVVSGLKLNLDKTKLFGVNVDENIIHEWANTINCDKDKLPTQYLGLPLGYVRNNEELWKPLVDKEDYWTDAPSLKVTFPRIYALAIKKSGKVAELGSLVNGVWVWNVELRRRLFDWELDVWSSFVSTIQKAASGFNSRDSLKWCGSSNGLYSPKAFCEVVALGVKVPNYIWEVVWSNLAPPNVEAFAWKVIHLRVPTTAELAKKGMARLDSNLCVLCSKYAEEYQRFVTNLGKSTYQIECKTTMAHGILWDHLDNMAL
ncbi:hypothetical protein GQ457_12G004390 [Hibiscus cannabinus]